MRRLRSRLTFANVCSLLALVIAIGTGGAYAANTIYSTDIVDGEVKAADIHSAAVQTAEVANNQIRSEDVRDDNLSNGGLTGADIANQSGVDTCTHGTARYGELCVGIAGVNHDWIDARNLCAGLELRMPSLAEGESLGMNYDLPTIGSGEGFWTEETFTPLGGGHYDAYVVVEESGGVGISDQTSSQETVCVTTPTN